MNLLIKFFLNIFDHFTEKQINKFLIKVFARDIPIIVDVGSHKGEYISNITKNFKFEIIYAFEPNPEIFQILKKKFTNNNNIKINNFGIGDFNDVKILNNNLESSSTTFNQLNTKSKYFKKKYFLLNPFKLKKIINPVKIEVIKLKKYINDNNINKIDLLKIDTEGYELKVLKGLEDNINLVNYIHLDHHFDDMIIKNYKLSDIHDYLKKNNFEKVFKIKMKFRKSFEYIYQNTKLNK